MNFQHIVQPDISLMCPLTHGIVLLPLAGSNNCTTSNEEQGNCKRTRRRVKNTVLEIKKKNRVGVEKLGCKPRCRSVSWRVTQRIDGVKRQGEKRCTCQNNQSRLASTQPPDLARGVGGLSLANHTPPAVFLNTRRWTIANLSIRRADAGAPHRKWHLQNHFKKKKKKKESEIIRDYLPQQRGTQVSTPVWRVAFHDLEMAKSNLGVDAGEKNKKRKNHCECPRLWWLWVIYYKTPGNTS